MVLNRKSIAEGILESHKIWMAMVNNDLREVEGRKSIKTWIKLINVEPAVHDQNLCRIIPLRIFIALKSKITHPTWEFSQKLQYKKGIISGNNKGI